MRPRAHQGPNMYGSGMGTRESIISRTIPGETMRVPLSALPPCRSTRALAGVAVVLLDAVRVVQQVPGGDPRADLAIGDREAWKVGADRLVQSYLPLVDELHEGEGGPGLAQGAALVDGVGLRGLARRD